MKKKRRKPAAQREEAVHEPGIDSGETLQPFVSQERGNARARDSAQEPRVTQESVGPCANLLDSEGDFAQLGGAESSGSDERSYLRAKLDDLKVKLGGEKAMPELPGPSGARGARASMRTEITTEVLQSLRKRLSLGDPASENVTSKASSQEGDDAVAILAKAIRRLIKGGNSGPGSGDYGREEDEDPLEQPFLAASARACQDLNIQARHFPGRFLADALSSMQRFLGVPGGSRQIIGGAPPGSYVPRDSLQSTLLEGKCWDPHIPGDAYAGGGHRLPPGRRQHEDGGPLDPAVQGVGDFRIRRVMVAGAAPGVDSRGGESG